MAITISFESVELRNLCLRPRIAIRKLGVELADELAALIADLQTIDNLSEIPHPIKLNEKSDTLTVDFSKNLSIDAAILEPYKKFGNLKTVLQDLHSFKITAINTPKGA